MTRTIFGRSGACRVLLCAALALVSLSPAEADEGKKAWFVWNGRESDGWDFASKDPVAGAKGDTLTYSFHAWRRTGKGTREGKLEVTQIGHRLKALFRDAKGKPVRAYDGQLGPEGRVVFGQAWDVGTSGPGADTRVSWWATTETTPTVQPVGPLDVNSASVAELGARGLSHNGARMIVQGRLLTLPRRSTSC